MTSIFTTLFSIAPRRPGNLLAGAQVLHHRKPGSPAEALAKPGSRPNIMPGRRILFTWVVTLFVVLPLKAEEPIHMGQSSHGAGVMKQFTLKDVLDIALKENPALKAADRKRAAAHARISQESSLDDPRIDLERMYAPTGSNPISGAEERNIVISQSLPFPTTLMLRRDAAKKEALMTDARYQTKEREILAQVKSTFAMFSLTHHHLEVLTENIGIMKRMARSVEARYAVGRASQGQVLKAQVELSRMLNMKIFMEQDVETNLAMLNVLMNQDPNTQLGYPEPLTAFDFRLTFDDLSRRALAESPMLAESAAGVEKGRVDLKLAKSSYLPELMLSYRRRDTRVAADSHDAMLGFTVPLWFWKQGAMVKEARADLEMLEAENEAARNMTRYQVKSILVKLDANLRLVQLYESSVIPQARQSLRAAESGYEANKMEFMDLIDANRMLLSFHDEYYQALADSQNSLAELERLAGDDLVSMKKEESK